MKSSAVVEALKRILRPLVRFLIERGITLPQINQLLKQTYVEVAEHDFVLRDKPQSDSRISMLTGVHRKDVRRLREQANDESAPPESISLSAQVVNNWLTERRYIDKQGVSKVLPLRSGNARVASFESLVASVSRQDLRPRVVLDELLRLKIVTLEDEHVSLLQDAFIPAAGDAEKLYYFAQNLRDHLAAATRNVQADKPAFLERAVTYHGLTADDVEEIRLLAESAAKDALSTVNQRAKRLKKRSEKATGNDQRINFGSYFFSGSEDDEQ